MAAKLNKLSQQYLPSRKGRLPWFPVSGRAYSQIRRIIDHTNLLLEGGFHLRRLSLNQMLEQLDRQRTVSVSTQ